MRALALDAIGGLDHLAVRDLPRPEIERPDDVRVRIRAAALNRLDLFVADGLPGVHYSFPHLVGSDGAGVVEAVGPAVSRVRLGDRVMINPGLSCGRCPACAEGEAALVARPHPRCSAQFPGATSCADRNSEGFFGAAPTPPPHSR